MRYPVLLPIALLLFSLSAAAQHQKMPMSGNEELFHSPDKDALEGRQMGFTQVTYAGSYSSWFDTSELFIAKYNRQGFLAETTLYEYGDGNKKDMSEPPFDAIRTRLTEGSRLQYTYDPSGNLLSRQMYDVVPANSFPAVYFTIMAAAQREMGNREEREEQKEESNTVQEARRLRYMKLAEDLIRKGVPERVILKESSTYEYNSDGNPVASRDEVERNSTRYTYTYDKAGRIAVQRQHYISTINSGTPYFSIQEVHFTYTPEGKVASRTVYIAEQDSSNVADPGNLRAGELYHYDARGLTDTIAHLKGSNETIRHIIAYKDTLRRGYTILHKYNTLPTSDTQSYTTYTYDGDLEEEVTAIGYYEGKRTDCIRTKTTYNARQPIEILTYYNDSPRDTAVLKKQSLFFYGNASDNDARRRSLYRPNPWQYEKVTRPLNKPRPVNRAKVPAKTNTTPNAAEVIAPSDVGLVEAPTPPRVYDSTTPFRYVEQMPSFPGDSLIQYLKTNLHYPLAARKAGMEGRVVVEFVVASTGKIIHPKVIRGLGNGLDEEALRLVSMMPTWRPGKQNGKAVFVYYTLPITFKLE